MKLYVANVPLDATEDGLRRHFSTCGGVAEVELLTDRQSGKPRGLARVTMTSPSFAAEACAKLDGAMFGENVLRVSETPVRSDAPVPSKTKIVQQFRERGAMTYEIDCAGIPLTLRFGSASDDEWNVEARARDTGDVNVVKCSAKTRSEALAAALEGFNAGAVANGGKPVDAEAVAKVMRDVRAI